MYPLKGIIYLHVLLLTGFILVNIQQVYSQCSPAAPAVGSCSGGNGAVSSNANINSGNSYWYSGTGATISNINFNGGILRICGSLTISSLNFNSGQIIVESGGSLIISSSDLYLNGNSSISNRGTLTFSGNVHMQNSNNYIWNASTSSYMTVTGTLEINSGSSKVINLGILNAGTLLIQSSAPSGAVCQQENAIINLVGLVNNTTNGIAYAGISSGVACVKVSGTAQLNSNVSNSAATNICKGLSVTMSGGAGWGSATVNTGCSSCSIVLPLLIIDFTAQDAGSAIKLGWTTGEIIASNNIFYIEKSTDGVSFSTIGSVPASPMQQDYSFADAEMSGTRQYYRIRQMASGNKAVYSPVVTVALQVPDKLIVYPNPVNGSGALHIYLTVKETGQVSFSLIDISGKMISRQTILFTAGKNNTTMDMKNTPPGIYLLKVESNHAAAIYSKVSKMP